jgi:hypothetical protein
MTEPTVRLDQATIERIAARTNDLVLANLLELAEERDEWAERLDLIADAVAERLRVESPGEDHLLDAAAVARRFGVSRDWVYLHADELGAMRLGEGSKARLRFDLEAVRAATGCSVSKRSQPENVNADGDSEPAPARRTRRLPNGLPEPGSILAARPPRAS